MPQFVPELRTECPRFVPEPRKECLGFVPARRNVRAMSRLRLRLTRRVELRGRVTVGKGVRIAVAPGARLVLEDGVVLGDGCRIEAKAGTVRIGAHARLGERSVVVAHAGIEVGAHSRIGDWALVSDAVPAFGDPEAPIRAQGLTARPLTVGERAVVGLHAAVQADVPAGATVTPYAVLTEPQSSA